MTYFVVKLNKLLNKFTIGLRCHYVHVPLFQYGKINDQNFLNLVLIYKSDIPAFFYVFSVRSEIVKDQQ